MDRKTLPTILCFAILLVMAPSCRETSNLNSSNSQVKDSGEANRQRTNEKSTAQSAAQEKNKSRASSQEVVSQLALDLEKRIETNPALAEIAKKNNAVVQWETELAQSPAIYTVNLQSVLIRNDKRPILFFGFLNDIAMENGRIFADFDVFPKTYLKAGRFIIECDQIQQLANQSASLYDEYAVVAVMSSVHRPKYKVNAKPLSESEAEIELDVPETFVANGRCLALVRVASENK